MGKKTTFLKTSSFIILLGAFSSLMAFHGNEVFGKEELFQFATDELKDNKLSKKEKTAPGQPRISESPAVNKKKPIAVSTSQKSSECEEDDVNPSISAPPAVTVSANSSCEATDVDLGTPVTSDNCEVAEVTNNAPTIFPPGTTTVTWTAIDVAGNTATASQLVTIEDTTIPTIEAPAHVTVGTNAGCEATEVTLGTPVTADNCEVDEVINDAPNTFPLGTTIVTWTVKDAAGLIATATQEIIVEDTTVPTITAPASVTVSANAGCEATEVALGAPVTADNCKVAEVNNDAPNTFPLGTTTVTWTVKDAAGLIATATQEVTVEDTTAPTITAPARVTVSATAGCEATEVALGTPVTADNCEVAEVNNDAPNTFPLGTTTVTWTVKDTAGLVATATQEIIVEDTTVPTITAPAPVTVSANADCEATEVPLGTPVTADNCEVAEVIHDAPSSFPLGTTTVTWTVKDAAGLTATATQAVTVEDTTDPTITAPAPVKVSANAGCEASGVALGNPVTADNCEVTEVINDAPTTFPLGNTTVTWTAKDAAGNSATATQLVTVEDHTNPTITAPAAVTVSANAACEASGVALGNPVTDDNCEVAEVINDAPTTFPLGNTTVTWTAKDAAGNSATATQIVTVSDTEKPVISSGSDITVSNDPGVCYASLSEITASATDNCEVGNPQGVRSDGQPLNAAYPAGTTIITWTVTDANGNSALPIEQKVTVEDNEAPKPPVLADVFSGCTYTFDVPMAVDNCTDNVTVTHDQPLTFSSTGTITWTFTDAAGNSSTAQQTVTINPLVTIVAEKVDVLCNGHATGEIRVTATGGVAPYTFDWGSLGAGDTKTDLPAGTYTVTAKDQNGCETAPLEVTIEEPETFVEISSIKTTTGCYQQNNGTATVTARGGVGNFSYLWDNGQTTQTATDLAPGSHSVEVTDQNGCTATRTFTISQPSELKITGFLTTETTSFGSATGTATVQVSGGTPNFTFSWSDQQRQTGQTARDLTAGTYTVTVSDANGCSTSAEVTIVDSLDAVIIPTSICEGEEEIVRTSYFEVAGRTAKGGTPGYTYEWNFGENASPATATGPGPHKVKYSVIGDKRITLKVTDSRGRTLEKQIIQYVGGCFSNDCGSNDLQADNYFIGDEFGNKITSSNCADAGQKYLYIVFPTNSTRYSLNIEYIYSITNIQTGEVFNDKEAGCFYPNQAIPTIARTIPIDYACGDIVQIEGIYLTFSNNIGWGCGQGPNPKCYSTNNQTSVTVPLYGVAFPNKLLCNGGSTGVINARASGGSGTYTYKLISSPDGETIRNYQTSSSFTGLSAGKYKVVINDGLETFTTAEIEIQEPENPLTLDLVSKMAITCFGGSDGTATVEASGGTPNTTGEPYIYIWEEIGQTTPTANNLSAGTYHVRVLDVNGCEASLDVVIEQPDQAVANAGPDQVLPCGNLETFLEAVQTEEAIPFEGTWKILNGPAGGVIEDVNDPNSRFTGVTGTYTLRWTGSCGATDDVKISFINCNTLDFDGVDDHVVIGDKFDLPTQFTIEAWVKQDPANTSGIKTIISERDNSALNAGGFDLIIDNNIPKFRWNSSTISSAYPIGSDRWYHIAVIHGGDFPGLYVDGIKVSDAAPGQPTATNSPLIIGAAYNSAGPSTPENYFHGWIEEVRIWKRAQTEEQLQFLMNQRLSVGSSPLKGTALPIPVPGSLDFNTALIAYYPLLVTEITNGITRDKGPNGYNGKMINIQTLQQNTAPLPYFSAKNGAWTADDTWLRPAVWDHPNSKGIDGRTFIDWNIVVTRNNITSQNKDITVLGLRNELGKLSMFNPSSPQNETNSGQMLRVTHYLKLDGVIDLFGESQLIQDEGSVLDAASKGLLERDQQGTASSYNYNYWTSPVSLSTGNVPYAIKTVMKDGTTTRFQDLNFGSQYHYADGPFTSPRRVSSYWLHKFHGTASNYFEWEHIGTTEGVPVAEGFSMKGTSGYASNTELQNYTFVGMPNNGTIELTINETPEGENYLVGNPYPSAISAVKFIEDNIVSNDIANSSFNGTLYFWDHFAKTTHYLEHYIGGYAVYNLAGAIEPASSVDSRIDNSDPSRTGSKRPGDFIPVGQAFFVNTVVAVNDENITSTGGQTIRFRNAHREYIREGIDKTDGGRDASVFHSAEKKWPKGKSSTEKRMRIWLKYRSPMGYHRQVLVTADANTTSSFDLGYDAPLMDDNIEDMFWLIHESEFVIQGVPDFNRDRVLPLGVKIDKDGVIKIEIDEMENIPIDFNIYLKDEVTGKYHDLRASSFETTAAAGTTKDRFSIVFHKETEDDGTPADTENPDEDEDTEDGDENEDGDSDEGKGDRDQGRDNAGENPGEDPQITEELQVFYLYKDKAMIIKNPAKVNIKRGTLYNGLGQKLAEFGNIPTETKVELPVQLNIKGVYIFNLESDSGSKSVKFMVE